MFQRTPIPVYPDPDFFSTTIAENEDGSIVTAGLIEPILDAPPWDFRDALAAADREIEARKNLYTITEVRQALNEPTVVDEPPQDGFCAMCGATGDDPCITRTGKVSPTEHKIRRDFR